MSHGSKLRGRLTFALWSSPRSTCPSKTSLRLWGWLQLPSLPCLDGSSKTSRKKKDYFEQHGPGRPAAPACEGSAATAGFSPMPVENVQLYSWASVTVPSVCNSDLPIPSERCSFPMESCSSSLALQEQPMLQEPPASAPHSAAHAHLQQGSWSGWHLTSFPHEGLSSRPSQVLSWEDPFFESWRPKEKSEGQLLSHPFFMLWQRESLAKANTGLTRCYPGVSAKLQTPQMTSGTWVCYKKSNQKPIKVIST